MRTTAVSATEAVALAGGGSSCEGQAPRAPRLRALFLRGVPPRAPRLRALFLRGVPPRAPRLRALFLRGASAPRLRALFLRGVPPRAPRLRALFLRGVPPRAPRLRVLFLRGAPSRSPAEGSFLARGAPSRSPAEGSFLARGTPSRSPAEGSWPQPKPFQHGMLRVMIAEKRGRGQRFVIRRSRPRSAKTHARPMSYAPCTSGLVQRASTASGIALPREVRVHRQAGHSGG